MNDEFWVKIVTTYFNDPVGFFEDILNFYPDDWQQEAGKSVRDNPKTAIRSGQGVGKTAFTACLILWYIAMHPYARIIATAPAAILRAQNIMHVKNKDEMIKEVKKKKEAYSDNGESNEIEYEFQFAWDRQATFLNAQSRAMAELRSLIKQYDEMLHKNWDLATAEQKARIDKLNFEISNLMGPKKSDSNSVQIVDDIDD
nr:hypothetical protein [Clostridium beijerinckii]